MYILLTLSGVILAGLLLSRVAKFFKLPAVTAYLVAGIIIGPYCLGKIGVQGLGFISLDDVQGYSLLCDIALGFIAFSIGNEFRMKELRSIGRQALVIGVVQAVFTTILVDVALIALHFAMPDKLPLPAAIVLGAIASATAPAATLMVVRQYKAKGPLTKILLPIVALDDAVGLVIFAISFGVAKSLISGQTDLMAVLLEPILEVVFSLILGAAMGLLLTFLERYFHSRSKRLSMSVAFVLLTVGISMMEFKIFGIHVAFSSLLVCMMLGTVFCNICDFSAELMDRLDRWTAPLYIIFFVASGAELELSVFADWAIVVIGVVYIIARSFGKYFGARGSAAAVKCDPNIVKYLGVTLLPQAGVALGMALKSEALPGCGSIIRNITLFAVLIYELVGPVCTKIALTKAGEIKPENRVSSRTHNDHHFAKKTQ